MCARIAEAPAGSTPVYSAPNVRAIETGTERRRRAASRASARSAADPAPIREAVGHRTVPPACTGRACRASSSSRETARVPRPTSTRTKLVDAACERLETMRAQQRDERLDGDPVRGAPTLDLVGVGEARKRRRLRERPDVVSTLHLPHRGDDGRRARRHSRPAARQGRRASRTSSARRRLDRAARSRRSNRDGRRDRGSRSTPRR